MSKSFQSQAEYEAALAAAAAYVELGAAPADKGGLQHDNLADQLADCRQANLEAVTQTNEGLETQLTEFSRRRTADEFLHRDSDGIGPTLGMDVSHS